jgi:hypothetical protein
MTKGVVMKKETEVDKKEAALKKHSKPLTGDRQRGFGVIELLFAATTLSTTLLVAAMSYTKKPLLSGD